MCVRACVCVCVSVCKSKAALHDGVRCSLHGQRCVVSLTPARHTVQYRHEADDADAAVDVTHALLSCTNLRWRSLCDALEPLHSLSNDVSTTSVVEHVCAHVFLAVLLNARESSVGLTDNGGRPTSANHTSRVGYLHVTGGWLPSRGAELTSCK